MAEESKGYPTFSWSLDSRGLMLTVRGESVEQLYANVEDMKKAFGIDTGSAPVTLITQPPVPVQYPTPPVAPQPVYAPPAQPISQVPGTGERYACGICGGVAYLNQGVKNGKEWKMMKCKAFPDTVTKGGHSKWLD